MSPIASQHSKKTSEPELINVDNLEEGLDKLLADSKNQE